MDQSPTSRSRADAARASVFTLVFGLAVLAFLTLINRSEWFHIRPMSGTAAAMAQASGLDPSPTSPKPVTVVRD